METVNCKLCITVAFKNCFNYGYSFVKETRVHPGNQDQVDLAVHLVHSDHQVHLDLLAQQDNLDQQAHQALLEIWDRQVIKDLLDHQDHLDHRDSKETEAM